MAAIRPIQIEKMPQRPSRPPRPDWRNSAILGHQTAAARDFADRVNQQMIGSVLPWPNRQAMLRYASRIGIPRVEANLLIAVVQNQSGHKPAKPISRLTPPRSRINWTACIFAGLGLEMVLGLAVFHWLF
jgi:hypothetical protein